MFIAATSLSACRNVPPACGKYFAAASVISLAGVALIFGQDNPPPRPDLANTAPLESEPGTSERPTATLEHNTVDLKAGKHKEDNSDK